MSHPELLTEIAAGIARITFNRPHVRNALTAGMVADMTSFLRECEQRDDVRVILLTGAGDHFMAGGDVKGFAEAVNAPADRRRAVFEGLAHDAAPLLSLMERIAKPIVAKVRGACAGASVGYVAGADFVAASDSAIFMVANLSLGLSPDGATTWHLPRVVGMRKAKQMCMLGERLTAQQALEVGLVSWIHADAELDEAVEKLLRRLAIAPTVAMGEAKRLLNSAPGQALTNQLALEAEAAGRCGATEDFAEGVAAFVEKRTASFRGR